MAKFTKAQKRQMQSALDSMDRAIAFIEQDRIAVCVKGRVNAEVHHGPAEYRAAAPSERQQYEGVEGRKWSIDWIETLQPIDKGIGSDLVSLYTARRTLAAILDAGQ